MQETYGNPFGLVGHAALEQMKLKPTFGSVISFNVHTLAVLGNYRIE